MRLKLLMLVIAISLYGCASPISPLITDATETGKPVLTYIRSPEDYDFKLLENPGIHYIVASGYQLVEVRLSRPYNRDYLLADWSNNYVLVRYYDYLRSIPQPFTNNDIEIIDAFDLLVTPALYVCDAKGNVKDQFLDLPLEEAEITDLTRSELAAFLRANMEGK